MIENAPTPALRHAIAISSLSSLRASEVAQLKVADCLHGYLEVRSGKSSSSVRKVVIHSQLVPIVTTRLAVSEFRGSGKALVKAFARYRQKKFGKQKGQADKTLHSLRHHWIDSRLKAKCEPYVVKWLAGHKLDGVTFESYWQGPSEAQVIEVMEAIKLPL